MDNQFLTQANSHLWQALMDIIHIPFDPSKRLYWLFLLSSLLMAVVWLLWSQHKPSLPQLFQRFFSRRYWVHPSSGVDISLLATNALLKSFILIPLIGGQLALTIIIARFLQEHFGNAPNLPLSPLAVSVLFTSVFFICEDASRFLLHRTMHRIPLLWQFHRTHHSANVLTPLTLYRVHPIEMTLYFIRGVLVFGSVSGVFVYLFGKKLSGLDLLGVDAFGFLFNLFGANLRHSHLFLGFGRLEAFFISPAQHQIHHSSASEHKDKNFGTCLAIWDKLSNAWVPSKNVNLNANRDNPLRFGLTNNKTLPTPSHSSINAL